LPSDRFKLTTVDSVKVVYFVQRGSKHCWSPGGVYLILPADTALWCGVPPDFFVP
jgi:hypothetical protein